MNPVHVRIRAPHLWVVAAACVLPLVAAAPASAQISPLGSAVDLVAFFVRGTDTVADPTTGGYVVVGGAGPILAVCVNAQGVRTAGPFTIKAPVGTYAAFPRVRYSPDVNNGSGGFLVVWPEEQGKTYDLHARIINCIGGPVGTEQIISGGASAWLESGAAVSYSPTSKKFFVAWKSLTEGVKGRLVDLNGAGEGAVVQLSDGFGRDPGVAWNSRTNEFGVSFSGEVENQYAYSVFARVPASNPAAFVRTTFNVIPGALTCGTDVDYNPDTDHFVMAWYEDFGGSNKYMRLAEFDSAGTYLGTTLASATWGSYDAVSLAFNPVSRSSLLVGVNRDTDVVIGAEYDRSVTRISAETVVAPPARYPRVSSSQTAKNWNVAFAAKTFTSMINQVVQTTTTGTATNPTPTPTPTPAPAPAPVPTPRMNVDVPTVPASVSGPFLVGGWAIDAGATSGSGVDAVHVWAFPTTGAAPTFLGAANLGVARPDVGNAFGQQFSASGFELTASIATPGTYDLNVYAHSTVNGTFNDVQTVRVTVLAPASIARMWVDTPEANQNLSQNIRVAGWAIDAGSSMGPGVDAVHVWAYPTTGAAPILVGVATYGSARPDVAAAFGSSRFTNSGFVVQSTLPVGEYDLVVFAHSAVVNAFNNTIVLRIRVM